MALVEHLDDSIGKVLDVLRQTGELENTFVAFTSDNGGSLPHAQNNDPWRDGKQSHYDGGIRVPFMVQWPGKIQPGTVTDYMGQTFDLFPTVVELAGNKPAQDLDAVSLLPILEGRDTAMPKERSLYFVRREGGLRYGGKSYEAMIRWPWKLMQNSPYEPLELYNLQDDPQESNNLADTEKRQVNELSRSLRLQIQQGGQVPWQP